MCYTNSGVEVEPQLGRRDAEVADSDGIPEPKLPRAIDLLPSVTLPKGGGAIRGLDEKLTVDAATGTCTTAVRVPFSPGRSGFTPPLRLSYDSGAGNGPFGLGWSLGVPEIKRKTDKGLPRYRTATSPTCSCWPAPTTWSRS